MQDRELYRRILGIESPWYVERVDLKLAEGEVHVYLEHQEVRHWACPECGAEAQPYDHQGGAGLAPSGHLPIPDDSAHPAAGTGRMPGAWRAGGEAALGGAFQPVHGAV